MNATVTAVIAVDEISVDWFWAITDRALDPRRPLVTEEVFRDNLAACKFEVRGHYNNPSLKILRYMVTACLWNHFCKYTPEKVILRMLVCCPSRV